MSKIEVRFTDKWKTNGVKMLGYGPTGIGKTYAISTCPRPFIINVATENGLLSLRRTSVPYITINNIYELEDAIYYLQQDDNWQKFDTLCIDSLSEVAEVCLAEQKMTNKDGRKAYSTMMDEMMERIRNLISIPGKNLYCICKQKKMQDDEGRILYSPDVPGSSFAQKLPYYFDEVFAFRVMKNPATGEMEHVIQTTPDEKYDAKDRSGNLMIFEEPDISKIISKI